MFLLDSLIIELPWLILSHLATLDIYLRLKHTPVFICRSLGLNLLFLIIQCIFSVEIQVSEFLMDLKNLLLAQLVWLSVDQALDGGQLVKNNDVLVGLLQVQVIQIRA